MNNGTVKILGKLSTLSDFAKIMENLYSDSMYDEDIVDGDKINAFLSALVNVDSDVSTWKNIKTIKSIYDGVIGIDNDNKLYICGNIGCNDKALMDFVKDYKQKIEKAYISDDESVVKKDTKANCKNKEQKNLIN